MLALSSLSACSESSPEPSGQAAAEAPASAAVETASFIEGDTLGRYEFAPTSCAALVENGVVDAEISGPGKAPDGEAVFVDFSSTGQELMIGLGVDRPFASPERRLAAGQYVTRPFTVSLDGPIVRATGLVLSDQEGTIVDDQARFEAHCR